MSINVLINSLISKLISQNNITNFLYLNSDQAIKKTKELKTLINNIQISQTSFIVVGAFLQNINLEIFSKEELTHLLLYNYDNIQSSKILPRLHKYDHKAPLYDLDNVLINSPYYLSSNIQVNFKKLQSINQNFNLEYLINYLTTQI